MFDATEMNFDCEACERSFKKNIFGLDRRFERVEFEASKYVIHVDGFDGLRCYCSENCMRTHFPREMAAQGIPIPHRRPVVGPVEVCARCRGPVDMTRYHLAFILDEWEVLPEGGGQTLWDECVAVVCTTCVPMGSTASWLSMRAR